LNKKAFSLIETIIAFMAFLIIFANLSFLINFSAKKYTKMQKIIIDLFKAQTILENSKSVDFDKLKSNEYLVVSDLDKDNKLLKVKQGQVELIVLRSRYE